MRLIQFILSLVFLIWLLIIAWPLFLVMAIVLIVAWVRLIRSVKTIQKNAFESEPIQRPTVGSDDIIDAEYTESEVEE